MARTDVYERILAELAEGELDELEVRVYHFLRCVYPAPMTRRELIESIFGYRPAKDGDLNNNIDDRKIRTAIASLFIKGVPVVSTSGGAGYHIDIDLNQWNEVIRELEGKRKTLGEKVDAAHRIVEKIKSVGISAIPTHVPSTPRQLSYMESRS